MTTKEEVAEEIEAGQDHMKLLETKEAEDTTVEIEVLLEANSMETKALTPT